MQQDEEQAVNLRARHRAIFERFTNAFRGKIVQYYGDGTLSIFHSAVEATQCAVEMQNAFIAAEIPVRIGLHVGDIILSEVDIIGDSVNLASRVESLAVAGSVLVTDKVISEIKNQTDLATKYLGKFHFKNDHRPRDIYAISCGNLVVPKASSVHGKTQEVTSSGINRILKRQAKFIIAGVLAIALVLLIVQGVMKRQEKRSNVENAYARIEEVINTRAERSSESENWEAFRVAHEALAKAPGDIGIHKLLPEFTHKVDIESEPAGARVFIHPYPGSEADASWIALGRTPLQQVDVPFTFVSIRVEKDRYEPVNDLIRAWDQNRTYKLSEEGSLPEGMVLVVPNIDTGLLNYLGFMDRFPTQDFYYDKFEVTNRKYKEFVDAGGYSDKSYWKYKFEFNGEELPWKTAIDMFVDKTGRAGPAGWEGNSYPVGTGDHPVSGVSWYEAAAYAEYAGKILPSWSHNRYMSAMWAATKVLPVSNFSGTGTATVGTYQGRTVFGVYDLVGNVGEWCFNASNSGARFILGGGWNNPSYVALQDDLIMDPMDRSESNGFRCMKYTIDGGIESDAYLFDPIQTYRRDYYKEEPVSDEVFSIFLNQFVYDRSSLNAHTEYEIEEEGWTKQKVIVDLPYGDERLPLYLFLPKNVDPPYQSVVYWPGSNAKVGNRSDDHLQDMGVIDFIIRSGRVVVYPVYKGSYERRFDDGPAEGIRRTFTTKGVPVFRNCNDMKVCWKEERVIQIKDLQRCIDYLESRNDIDPDKIVFQGRSWGGRMAPMALAVESRIHYGIVLLGGFSGLDLYPESDPFHYAPRVKVPILMLGGNYDNIRPLQTLQKPFFEMLGTPAQQKELKTFDTAHSLPRAEMIKAILDWLDQTVGGVE